MFSCNVLRRSVSSWSEKVVSTITIRAQTVAPLQRRTPPILPIHSVIQTSSSLLQANIRSQSTMSSSQPTVTLPVSTASQSVQKIVGKSGKSKELEEFRGIPFGTIPARWRHSSLRTRLPEDTFYAVKNG